MPADRSKRIRRTRWTVPQVAYWIRHRQPLRLTAVAKTEQPFERPARAEILEALASGRIVAKSNGRPIEASFWGKGSAFLSRGRRAMAGLYSSAEAVTLDSLACTRTWPAPADLLRDGPMPLRVLLDQLGEDQKQDMAGPVARWFLTLPGVVVTGLNGLGQRSTVDAQVLIDGDIGRHDGSIVGRRGQQRWTDVTVASASRRGGRTPIRLDRAVEYLRIHHPSGLASDLKREALFDDMRKAGLPGSDKTLRRAIDKAYGVPKRRK